MILTIVGARPQFVKAAVVSNSLRKYGIAEQLVHTGQHYDHKLSDVFWQELGLPEPVLNLEVGSDAHAAQTAKILVGLENYITENSNTQKFKAVLLYGDTNSTIAGALVASKLNIPIIHVEAGLRSFNRTMPEEINRIVTDHLSAVLFCSSDAAIQQLAKEGITQNVFPVGDVMYDAILFFLSLAEQKITFSDILSFEKIKYNLLTLHRPANTDNPDKLQQIFDALSQIDLPIIWPVHPRMKNKIALLEIPANIQIRNSFSYFEMLIALNNCYKVFTDSGGLQKEAYWLKKPCITLRDETEWIETMQSNWNIITKDSFEKIVKAYNQTVDIATWKPLYGNGKAGDNIAKIIKEIYYK